MDACTCREEPSNVFWMAEHSCYLVLASPLLPGTDRRGIQSPCLLWPLLSGPFIRDSSCHSSDVEGRTIISRCNHRAELKAAFIDQKLPCASLQGCQAGIQAGTLAVGRWMSGSSLFRKIASQRSTSWYHGPTPAKRPRAFQPCSRASIHVSHPVNEHSLAEFHDALLHSLHGEHA